MPRVDIAAHHEVEQASPGFQEAAHSMRATHLSPILGPIFGSLAGVCPVMVFVGTRDLVLGDARRLATAAQQVAVEPIEAEQMVHAWPVIVALPEARVPIARMAALLAAQ
ncbi:MAG: alpha/beta hydrolase fold domain-containing protein [Deltaproteobacteria bacterium]